MDDPQPSLTAWMPYNQLFKGLSSGWLTPDCCPDGRFALSPNGEPLVFNDDSTASAPGPIPVQVELDMAMMPFGAIPVMGLHDEGWEVWDSLREAVERRSEVVAWPGAIPSFAVTGVKVEGDEPAARLKGLAGATSDIAMPPVSQVDHDLTTPCRVSAMGIDADALNFNENGFHPTYDYERVAGAMAMRGWCEREFPGDFQLPPPAWEWPLGTTREGRVNMNFDDHLWIAAEHRLRCQNQRNDRESVDLIADQVVTMSGHELQREASDWKDYALQVLDARRPHDPSPTGELGMAVGMALCGRSIHSMLRDWLTENPTHTAPVCAAALLHGAKMGFSELPGEVKGADRDRMLTHVRALKLNDRRRFELWRPDRLLPLELLPAEKRKMIGFGLR